MQKLKCLVCLPTFNKLLENFSKAQLVGFGWSDVLGFNLFLFLLTLGPSLPKRLEKFAMHEHYGDIYVFGGIAGSGDFQSTIYKLSCSNIICSWTNIDQSLKEATKTRIAIHVPDSFCT